MNKPLENLKNVIGIVAFTLFDWLAEKTYNEFRSRLWRAMLRLFHGGRDANFLGSFVRSIDQQLTEAWNEGAADMGVQPDEMSDDDIAILEAIVNSENDFVNNLADDIQGARESGVSEEQFVSGFGARCNLWANRYTETVNRARMQFGAKVRLMWQEGATEDKCETCKKLDGIVAFGYEWEEAGFHPQMPPNDMLECEGWNCQCTLEPTTRRRTPRALDKLTSIAVSSHL